MEIVGGVVGDAQLARSSARKRRGVLAVGVAGVASAGCGWWGGVWNLQSDVTSVLSVCLSRGIDLEYSR